MEAEFFLAGFECACHRRPDGRRLDLLASTGHARWFKSDYRRLRSLGIGRVRDGVRWHLVESANGRYDWEHFDRMLEAAQDAGLQVIWDLCHYGWPDHYDIWSPAFVNAFADFAQAVAQRVAKAAREPGFYCPVNEISYFAWAGGETGRINPFSKQRGAELKQQLVRASIAAMTAIRSVQPAARFLHAEPLIHVAPRPGTADAKPAEHYRIAQFEAWEMLSGERSPELGGAPEFLDLLGVNFYPDNQWYLGGGTIPFGHHDYRPLRSMLAEASVRFRRPLLIAETGAEGTARAPWLHYVAAEVRAAMDAGVPLQGLCLYPVLNYPGWDNDRLCPVGLLGEPRSDGERDVYEPLREELHRQSQLFSEALSPQASAARRHG